MGSNTPPTLAELTYLNHALRTRTVSVYLCRRAEPKQLVANINLGLCLRMVWRSQAPLPVLFGVDDDYNEARGDYLEFEPSLMAFVNDARVADMVARKALQRFFSNRVK